MSSVEQVGVSPKDRRKGIALVLVSGACWGFHGVLIKLAYRTGATYAEVFLAEAIVASLIFALLFWKARPNPLPKTKAEWGLLIIAGVASACLGNFLFLSFSLGPVAIGATLLFLYLPQVYLFSLLTGQQSWDWLKAVSIVLLLVGASISTGIYKTDFSSGASGALLAGLAASVCYATIFVITPKVSANTTATFRSLFISVFSALGCLIALLLVPSARGVITASVPELFAYALVLGTLGQTLPVITLMKGIPLAGPSLSGVLASTELPIAVIASAIVLSERITVNRAIGVGLVFTGIILFNSRNKE